MDTIDEPTTDSEHEQAAPPSYWELPEVERAARLEFARRVYTRSRGRRDVEGEYDLDTGKWNPTVREDVGHNPPRQAAVSKFRSWHHVFTLCLRACNGLDVPPDIAKYRDELWPKVHEVVMVATVNEQLKAETKAFEKAQKRERLLAEMAERDKRENRIKAKQAQAEGLRAKLKKLAAKQKALETRLKRIQKSISALERYEAKEKGGKA